MLLHWQKQHSIIEVSVMNNHIRIIKKTLYYLGSNPKIILRNRDKLKQPSCSLRHEGKEKLQNIKTWTNWQSSFLANIDGKWWKSLQLFSVSDHGVDLPEPTAISKSCQRPKRNFWARHLHISSPTTLKFWCFLPSAWSFDSHKSHLRRGGRTWYPECNWNYAGAKTLKN